MTDRLTTIELFKQDMKFSAAHFTIFSKTERESLHGHNYNVHVAMTNWVGDFGLSYDYRNYKYLIKKLCKELNQKVILPQHSPYLTIDEKDQQVNISFNQQHMSFYKDDVNILPINNTTLEELSHWFITRLTEDIQQLTNDRVQKIRVKVFSAPGQCGSCEWVKHS